ncbi:MAG: hypothetical protein COY82_02345 [Parcubacteria group bacterium CG_4_10_14_0_8_um_filter_35_7]|nr:MAG: hypothetical protein COX43_01645 [Parcubacteria group bacterium CG23_combo_of_CG06-09_8_20_14_all_35_9]PIY78466.1 MAG: hypothetical protein COY82_02345 [Parcubacteria group bacterium CG_4_10_14_0_8_um_filter_35_7]
MKVAIIIVTYNGREYLPELFKNLFSQSYPQEKFFIIVVDNGSSDETARYIKESFPEAELIQNRYNVGFAEGNNIGVRVAIKNGADYVVFLNQDTIVASNWLEELVKVAESDKTVGMVQSKILLWTEKDKINSLGNHIHFLGFAFCGGYKEQDKAIEGTPEITYASGAAMLVKIEVLEKVGLFDKDLFLYHEDVDLGWRTRLMGYRIVLAPKSIVYHKYEFARSVEKYYWMERNRFVVMLKNYKWSTLLFMSLPLAFMEAGLLFYSLFSGEFLQKLKGYFYFLNLFNLYKIFKKREKIQKNRKIKDKDIIKFFVGKIEFQEIENPILKHIINPLFNFYWLIAKRLIVW